MKFSISWLKEHLETTVTLDEITDTLTAIGLEVEKITDRAEELAPFTVAEILKADKHPDADKLSLCTVNTGSEELQIVCGAPNAKAGIKVVLAKEGVTIPNGGFKIKKTKIRGVESIGMMCSAAELNIGENSSGIIELPENAVVGEPFAGFIGLDDPVIEIAITPNRGDCLGVRGIARDLAATGLGKLKELSDININCEFASPIHVTIANTEKTPMFIGCYIKGVHNGDSPDWLKNRLESIGLKSISALVDITNYLTFDLGRPAHVYDADKLKGNLVVRNAVCGEKITALDEKEYTLEEEMTVIADDNNAVSIGGIIGGISTGCTEDTTNVFLEIALFEPISVAKTGRNLQIDSDARYRFERAVDPAFLEYGASVATKLILDICGGKASKHVIAGVEPNWKKTIPFRTDSVGKLIGIDVSSEKIEKILISLGFNVDNREKTLSISPPSWRNDVEQEADLIEEIARIHGYENIPSIPLPQIYNTKSILDPFQVRKENIRKILASRGMKEAVTFSFISSDDALLFSGSNDNIALENPISADLGIMRPSILPNLLNASANNAARGKTNLSIFEVGPVFDTIDNQQLVAGGIRCGNTSVKNHYADEREYDVFDIKADALAALSPFVSAKNIQVVSGAPEWYHKGKSGTFKLGKNIIGYFGEIHPSVLNKMGVNVVVTGFEVFIEKAPKPKDKKSFARPKPEFSNFQAVVRDFAFIVDKQTHGGDLLKAVEKSDKKLVSDVSLFDVYEGKGIEDGKKSLAISVTFEPKDHTLTDKEIEILSDKIISSVQKTTGGILRCS